MPYNYTVDFTHQWKVWGHYAARVELKILPWCKSNCGGQFRQSGNGYVWHFEKLEDATAFRLAWDEQGY